MGRSGGRESIKSSPKDKGWGKLDDLCLFLGVEVPHLRLSTNITTQECCWGLPKVKFHIKSTLEFATMLRL